MNLRDYKYTVLKIIYNKVIKKDIQDHYIFIGSSISIVSILKRLLLGIVTNVKLTVRNKVCSLFSDRTPKLLAMHECVSEICTPSKNRHNHNNVYWINNPVEYIQVEISMELQSIATSLNHFLTDDTANFGLQVTTYPWILNFSDESISDRQWTCGIIVDH